MITNENIAGYYNIYDFYDIIVDIIKDHFINTSLIEQTGINYADHNNNDIVKKTVFPIFNNRAKISLEIIQLDKGTTASTNNKRTACAGIKILDKDGIVKYDLGYCTHTSPSDNVLIYNSDIKYSKYCTLNILSSLNNIYFHYKTYGSTGPYKINNTAYFNNVINEAFILLNYNNDNNEVSVVNLSDSSIKHIYSDANGLLLNSLYYSYKDSLSVRIANAKYSYDNSSKQILNILPYVYDCTHIMPNLYFEHTISENNSTKYYSINDNTLIEFDDNKI